MSKDIILKVTNQQRSNGGKKAASNMTAEERSARAKKANLAKKCYKGIQRATHSGELEIGNSCISCAVLEDGTRVINEASMFEILGRHRTGRKKGEQLPAFLAAINLKPFIDNDLKSGAGIITFVGKTGGKSYGYDATLIPEICKIYLDARRDKILTPSQLPTAEKAEIILHSLAKVGITSLIDEATGYQLDRENDELQKLFSRFIAKELQPWTKRFPNDFFENLKTMYGIDPLRGNPQFAGHFINKYIYKEISEDVLEELKRKNPLDEKGYRKNRHHQFLTSTVGHPTLERQIVKVNTLMSVSSDKDQFEDLYEKTRR